MDYAAHLGSLIFCICFDQYRSTAGRKLRNLCGDCGYTIFMSFSRVEHRSKGRAQDFNGNCSVTHRILLLAVAVGNEHPKHWGFACIKLNVVEKPNNETLLRNRHWFGSGCSLLRSS